MRIVRLVPAITRSTADTGAWLVRHMVQPRTTVEAWMVRRGIDLADRRRWASAVGRKVAQVARARGVEATRERIAIGAGKGWTDAYVYPADSFADIVVTAWTAPDAKGRSFADKIGGDMAFKVNDRVRLRAGAPGSSKEGTVVVVSAPPKGRGRTCYAVRWDGEGLTVPGYRENELEKLA